MRVMLLAKMLKETETEETIGFLSHFCHWRHFHWEGPGSLAPSLYVRLCHIAAIILLSKSIAKYCKFLFLN